MAELAQFHFLRPGFLLLIPLLLGLTYYLSRRQHQGTGFEQWIDQHLLQHIQTQSNGRGLRKKLPYVLLSLAWFISAILLAGPTYKQLPQALHQSEQAMVIVLDLSPSMLAEDIKPSRIVRARLKIQDLLSQRKDGLSALVVYAGEAHVVTPLTDDSKTIINLLSTLKPGLLPIPGSNTEMAVDLSKQLIYDSGISEASIVLITDGIEPSAQSSIKANLNKGLSLYILGIGTEKGAPIPLAADQQSANFTRFMRDENSEMIIAKRDGDTLKSIANSVDGYYLPLQADSSDIDFIISNSDRQYRQEQSRKLDRQADQWEELAPLLLLICLPFFALMFRRGWLLALVISTSPLLIPEPAYALSWDELWLNDNQRAQQSFEQEDYAKAQQGFNDKQWQGSAAYKNQDYEAALEAFSQGDSAVDDYNRGNALSQLQRWDEAISAYNQALEKDPGLTDAEKNKALVEAIKKQQQDQQNQDSQDQSENNQDSDDQESQKSENNQGENSEQGDNNNTSPDSPNEQGSQEDQKQDQAQQQQAQEQQAEAEQEQNAADNEASQSPETSDSLAHLSEEEKQELEQWIRKIPDDPSGLLRRKFEYEFQKRRQLYQSGQWELPDNNAHKRY